MHNINNTQKILDIIKQFLIAKKIECDYTIVNAVNKRNEGHVFSFSEHLKAMIFSLLSSQTSWSKFDKNYEKICNIFFDFDRVAIKKQLNKNVLYFSNEMKNIKCSHQNLENQMQVLAKNIATLEKIEAEYGLIDNYVTSQNIYEIINSFSQGKYKLHQMGVPLVCEYLRNVGFNLIKPDRHTKRILGSGCLAIGNRVELQDFETLDIAKEMEKNSTYKQFEIDFLLWHFCAKNYGEICIKNSPKCNICPISVYCKQSSNVINFNKTQACQVINNMKKGIGMNNEISIAEKIEEYLKQVELNSIITTNEFSILCNDTKHSYIISDYCYNRFNNGINFEQNPHFFLYLKRGHYKYVGKNYNYTGPVYHKPAGSKFDVEIGKCVNGKYIFTK